MSGRPIPVPQFIRYAATDRAPATADLEDDR